MYFNDKRCFCEDCGREISREEYQENMGFCDICFDWHEENDVNDDYHNNYFNEELWSF